MARSLYTSWYLFGIALEFGVLILCGDILLCIYEAKVKTKNYLIATVSQLVYKSHARKVVKNNVSVLETCPQKRGICTRAYTTTPKKLSPTLRKVCRVRLTDDFEVTSCIGGEGHSLQEHSVTLIRGDRIKGLPGVRYHTVRGALDCSGVKDHR